MKCNAEEFKRWDRQMDKLKKCEKLMKEGFEALDSFDTKKAIKNSLYLYSFYY